MATGNAGKRAEFERLLRRAPVRVLDLSVAGETYVSPPEDGDTYAANARLKARAAAAATGRVALADDSGLEVEALGGRPGVHSARFGGEGLDDAGRVRLLLAELAEIVAARRQATFVCRLCLAVPDGTILAEVEARLGGRIAAQPRGRRGFGYDPVFEVPALRATMAELSGAAKDGISHRGRATALLVPTLARLAVDFRPVRP